MLLSNEVVLKKNAVCWLPRQMNYSDSGRMYLDILVKVSWATVQHGVEIFGAQLTKVEYEMQGGARAQTPPHFPPWIRPLEAQRYTCRSSAQRHPSRVCS